MSKYNELSLVQAAEAIKCGDISSEALVGDCLSAIAQYESKIRAWASLDPHAALEKARHADTLRAQAHAIGPLHGVPMGIKDIFLTKDIPTAMGSPIYRGFIPTESATVVRRLERSGALVLGKTVTSEFASQQPGETRNPWNLDFSPGGSSSGSAAAVAARFVPAAIGSQTRGSTIRPAAYCGVVGYKPTFGLISCTGMNPLSGSLDHVGLMARDVADVALLFKCCVEYDSTDPASDRRARGYMTGRRLYAGKLAPRIAAVRTGAWKLADAPQRNAFEKSLVALKTAGATVEEVVLTPLLERAHEVIITIHRCEMAQHYRDLQSKRGDEMSPRFAAMVREGCAIHAVDYLDALSDQRKMMAEVDAVFSAFDAIVTPPATGEPPQGLEYLGDAAFNSYWTLVRTPCVTIPVDVTPNGLPIGLQIVGRCFDDDKLLKIAEWCQGEIAFSLPWPATRNAVEPAPHNMSS